MMPPYLLNRRAVLGVAGALLSSPWVHAADPYPSRPIKLLVPYPPGGSPDLIARALSISLGEKLGQPVAVENRTGANGMVATEAVARSAADGYTLLLASDGPLVITPLLKGESPHAPSLKLAPITLVAESTFVLLAHPSLPVKDLASLVAYEKQHPGKLTFGSSGIGSQHHLAGELLSSLGRMKLVHVPYKGFGEAVTDAAAGRIDLLFGSITAGAPHVASGRLKAITVTAPARAPLLPQVATSAEQGFPALEVSAWFGVMAPLETPPSLLTKLDDAIRASLATESVKSSLTKLGLDVQAANAAQYGKRIQQDRFRWAEVIKSSGLKVE
jgi:tripartite-type tricarboxylate transporter receptor subunit TctC